MLEDAQKEKDSLNFRKTAIEIRQDDFAEDGVSLENKLEAAEADVASLTTMIPTLSEGPVKAEKEALLLKAEWTVKRLQNRRAGFGIRAVLTRQREIGQIEGEVVNIDAFMAEVNTRKTALAA